MILLYHGSTRSTFFALDISQRRQSTIRYLIHRYRIDRPAKIEISRSAMESRGISQRPVYREQVRDTVPLLYTFFFYPLPFLVLFSLSRRFCALAGRRRRVCPANVHSVRTCTHARTHVRTRALTRPPRNAQDGLRGE